MLNITTTIAPEGISIYVQRSVYWIRVGHLLLLKLMIQVNNNINVHGYGLGMSLAMLGLSNFTLRLYLQAQHISSLIPSRSNAWERVSQADQS